MSLYPLKLPYTLAWDWTWVSTPTCSRTTDKVSDTECLLDKDVLTIKLAVNSNRTSHKINTSGMTFCKVWIVVLEEKDPRRNTGGCTCARFWSKWRTATIHPDRICSKTTEHTSTNTPPTSKFIWHLQVVCISVSNMITNSQNNTIHSSLTHYLKRLTFSVCVW